MSELSMSTKPLVLVIDDDPGVRRVLALALNRAGYEVMVADSGESGIELATRLPPRVVLVDVQLGGMDGLQVTRRLAQEVPSASILIMTGYATIENAVEAMQSGACDYLIKPLSPVQVGHAIEKALQAARTTQELAEVRRTSGRGNHLTFTSQSPVMQQTLAEAAQAAATSATVLLQGETGTGKSALARHIHDLSTRSSQPFVTVQCAVISPSLIESELFGHKQGSFTGATHAHAGLIETAAAGTLLLDEIGDLAQPLQGKLLRLLEEREYVRVGDSLPRRSEARIIAATHCDLRQATRSLRFREDLYYRLNVLTIRVPPLRERPEDIRELARSIVRDLARRHRGVEMEMTPDLESSLVAYRWPGNLRELVNVLERAIILARRTTLSIDLLPEEVRDGLQYAGKEPGGEDSLAAAERRHLMQVLARYPTLESAARALGIDPSTLYRKRERYGLL
jgi:NtrC-family two-component system response regulator AlgB